MRDSSAQVDCGTKKVRDWLLALLRYAADKSAILVIAKEIDKFGSSAKERSAFKFFRRTSTELCSAILDAQNSKKAPCCFLI